jgi:hypothetical protein
MNLFVLFDDGAITRKNITETLHLTCATRNGAVSQYFSGDIPSPNNK